MFNTKAVLSIMALATVLGSAVAEQGYVYVPINEASGNRILVYRAGNDGVLSYSGAYATGGNGTGSGLGSQGAIALSENGHLLYAVDAGSDDLAVFAVDGDHLRRLGNTPSGGTMPISVTANRGLVYVLNAGGAGNIAGFRSRGEGDLEPITLSARPLSASGVGPAQIQFTPDGDALVVTEKATNTIDTWPMFGPRPGPLFTNPSEGTTPFGFDFDNRGHLLVSEAAGGAPNGSSASSYRLGQAGWIPIIGSAATNQTAACWGIASPNGRFFYTANAGSASVSGFSVAANGALTLLTPSGVTGSTGPHPVDMGFSRSGRYLYVLANGNGTIAEFRANADGTLTSIGTATGVPLSAQGLAAN